MSSDPSDPDSSENDKDPDDRDQDNRDLDDEYVPLAVMASVGLREQAYNAAMQGKSP